MRETISNGCQIMSDGTRVWVNGSDGASLARLGRFGRVAMIDVHKPLREQGRGGECLDCRGDLDGPLAWRCFVDSVKLHHNVRVGEEHRPSWVITPP